MAGKLVAQFGTDKASAVLTTADFLYCIVLQFSATNQIKLPRNAVSSVPPYAAETLENES